MIIGTAGHIDHGKSALVTALTGQAMDRLKEERRRGITIDLNFAPMDLGGGHLAGVVDVPGHEDFVRTMVAGASGIDLALLVVAADEGVMPQTEEHLAIIEQLGVSAGIPVITKIDLVEPDWIELVAQDLAERLSRSPIGFDPPIAVSARTGVGIESLRERLRALASEIARPYADDLFRLPIDRSFSVAGVGTVVTGTAWSGRIAIGDWVRVLPGSGHGRVRSIEGHGRAMSQSEPGGRTAVGIAGLDRAETRRGSVLVGQGAPWDATSAVDVELVVLPSAPLPLRARPRVRLLLGTAEVMARVLPRSPLEPGQQGPARLVLEQPLVARGGDRFVLRSFSPVTTIGGGRVLDPFPPRRRSLWPVGLPASDPAARFQALLERRPAGIHTEDLPLLLGLPPAGSARIASAAPGVRKLEARWVSAASLEAIAARALEVLRQYHHTHISDPGLPLETLRHSLHAHPTLVDASLGDLERARRIRRTDGLVALSGFVPRVAGGEAEIDRVVRLLSQAELSPPTVAELSRLTGRTDVAASLRLAAARGDVEAVERDRYYSREALQRFTRILEELGRDRPIVPADVRDRLGISRKFLIPLLEWADGKGVTVRVGDARRLRSQLDTPARLRPSSG
jgi:selenocysteine-specific elongation factor